MELKISRRETKSNLENDGQLASAGVRRFSKLRWLQSIIGSEKLKDGPTEKLKDVPIHAIASLSSQAARQHLKLLALQMLFLS